MRLRDILLRHPHAVQVFATRPVRSSASIDTGVKMLTKLHAAGIPSADALRITRCLREFTIGHALAIAVTKLGAERRSRKPRPDSPDYNLLAEAAEAAAACRHRRPDSGPLEPAPHRDRAQPAGPRRTGGHRRTGAAGSPCGQRDQHPLRRRTHACHDQTSSGSVSTLGRHRGWHRGPRPFCK